MAHYDWDRLHFTAVHCSPLYRRNTFAELLSSFEDNSKETPKDFKKHTKELSKRLLQSEHTCQTGEFCPHTELWEESLVGQTVSVSKTSSIFFYLPQIWLRGNSWKERPLNFKIIILTCVCRAGQAEGEAAHWFAHMCVCHILSQARRPAVAADQFWKLHRLAREVSRCVGRTESWTKS